MWSKLTVCVNRTLFHLSPFLQDLSRSGDGAGHSHRVFPSDDNERRRREVAGGCGLWCFLDNIIVSKQDGRSTQPTASAAGGATIRLSRRPPDDCPFMATLQSSWCGISLLGSSEEATGGGFKVDGDASSLNPRGRTYGLAIRWLDPRGSRDARGPASGAASPTLVAAHAGAPRWDGSNGEEGFVSSICEAEFFTNELFLSFSSNLLFLLVRENNRGGQEN
uniref:Uncharacterized protein n=1 Tax=Oryza glumipatula TaxID=40148 RepID=A0A0E0AZ92_9ORYZ